MALQYDFAANSDVAYNIESRLLKGEKTLAVLEDCYSGDMSNLRVLDIGCSTGAVAYVLASRCAAVLALDIDEPAIEFASRNFRRDNLNYRLGNALETGLPDESYDVVVCAHI